MNTQKLTAILVATAFALPLASAATVNFEYTNGDTTLQPNQNQEMGTVTVDFDGNTTFSEVESRNLGSFPFPVESVNETFYDENGKFNATLMADVPQDFPPTDGVQSKNYTYTFTSLLNTSEVQGSANYQVPLVNNISVSDQNISKDLNVGDRGNIYTNITVTQTGNAERVPLNYNVTGNISQLLDNPTGSFTLYRTNAETIFLQTDIPLNQQYGNYTGTLEIMADQENATVDLRSTVSDIVAPEIKDKEIEDIQATREKELEFEISDNIGVKNASVRVLKETVDEDGNSSEEEYTSFNLTQRENNQNIWYHEYTSTSERGNYTAEITAFDTSGNKVEGSSNFEIIRLEAVTLETTNFEFDAAPTDEQVEEHIASVDFDTPVNFTLDQFTHDQENSSIIVGIKRDDMETAEEFDLTEENKTLEFEEEGDYSLVVDSDVEESFRGDIIVQPIEEHAELEKIDFSGIFIDPEYPEPDSWQFGQFEGQIFYENDEDTVKDTIVFEGRADAERCRGAETWSECLTGFSLNEAEQLETDKQNLQDEKGDWQIIAGVSWILLFVYILAHRRAEMLEDKFHMFQRVSYDE